MQCRPLDCIFGKPVPGSEPGRWHGRQRRLVGGRSAAAAAAGAAPRQAVQGLAAGSAEQQAPDGRLQGISSGGGGPPPWRQHHPSLVCNRPDSLNSPRPHEQAALQLLRPARLPAQKVQRMQKGEGGARPRPQSVPGCQQQHTTQPADGQLPDSVLLPNTNLLHALLAAGQLLQCCVSEVRLGHAQARLPALAARRS